MGYYWDWSRLPEDEKPVIKELFLNSEFGKVMVIHNRYKLSYRDLCCGSDVKSIQVHVRSAIDRGII